MKHIILASTSPRRKELLERLGVPFTIEPSDYVEDMTLDLLPEQLVLRLAKEKAATIASKRPDAIVIAADTIVVFNGEILGKPKDVADAKRMLRMLSNELHDVYTGYVVRSGEKEISGVESVLVQMKQFTEEFINEYSASESLDKAGAYAIQSEPTPVAIYNGEYTAVMGLPLPQVEAALKQFGALR
jgi:septum formation protein